MSVLKKMTLSLGLIVLTACSTVEIVHSPVGCLGQPVFADDKQFTHEDIQSISLETEAKIRYRMAMLRERIATQCAINKKHDELHSE